MKRLLGWLGPFLGVLLVILLFSLRVPESFLSAWNLKTVATQTVIVALGAIGMTFVVVAGGIDLSIGSVVALSSVVTAWLLRAGWPAPLAALGGVLCGTLCGHANGRLVVGLRVVPFLVTLGTMGIARGLAKFLADEQKIDAPGSWLPELMARTPEPAWLLLAPGVWLLLLLALVLGVLLHRSVFGVAVYAVGSNEHNAALCGVPVGRVKVQVYTLCGLLAGIAGVLHFARLTVGDPTAGLGLELQVIAAVVIGGGSLAGGEGSIVGAVAGAFLMALLSNGCTLMGWPTYVQEIAVGVVIVVAVALDRWRRA